MPKEKRNKTVYRDESGKFLPNNPGGPGRPKGSESFSTKWKKFIEKVAEENGMKPSEIDEQLYRVAFKKAREGDYQFYRDIQDRVHGKSPQSIDITSDGEKLESGPSDDAVKKLASDFETKLKEHFTNGTE